ncbi:hypothetical protein K7565_18890 [Stenotrophomonas maltophilia]|uniref:hypothetical protein n=1 Tax=Stenotrophomonas maltophilia TaxID=40324 RepID=UPI001D1217DA|nr:hypothetical protein [Stenotrophomonas maltophilia]UKJ25489.1 hypothetical protein L6173_19555 [Stenotrophomonas maltophilia]UXB15827.1 hypothetical protein K7565_18890 [Stenotrophomonas maltophilia]
MNSRNFFQIKSEFASRSHDAANSAIESWPPPDDYPLVVDEFGSVVSRIGDPYWNFTPWTRTPTRLSFESVSSRRRSVPLDQANAKIFKYVVLTWLFGPNRAQKPSSVVGKFELMRPLFVLCTQTGISAADLWRFPAIVSKVKDCFSRARARESITILHQIYLLRRETGFFILLPEQINELASNIPRHERIQTPYIPPRIWVHLMQRCKSCLEDFIDNSSRVEALFKFSIESYRVNLMEGKNLYVDSFSAGRNPFSSPSGNRGTRTSVVIHGPFQHCAEQFGVRKLLSKWIKGTPTENVALKVSDLSKYLSLVTLCGEVYISCFALARVNEGRSLRAGCIEQRVDSLGLPLTLIKGQTTKTIEEDTYWIGSDFCKNAVVAMERVSLLRMSCAIEDPRAPATEEDLDTRPLRLRAYEPWIPNSGDVGLPIDSLPGAQALGKALGDFEYLLDDRELQITPEDLSIALSVTPGLNPEKFAIGKRWHFAWHQLRRTGAVNMNSSSLVSDKSLQLQLKHSAEAMTRYYTQGYYHLDLVLDEGSRKEFLLALYDGVAKDMTALQEPYFSSPFGDNHKSSLLNLVSEKKHNQLVNLARQQDIPYRTTLLGACTNPSPCQFGGVDALVECAGRSDFCAFVLLDRRKIPALGELKADLRRAAREANPDSPLYASLTAQVAAIERVEDCSR